MNKSLLTILIPTRNRLDHVSKVLGRFSNILEDSNYSSEVEIVVADNFSQGDLKKVVLDASKNCKNIKYKKHLKERHTAESSMAHSVGFCNGKYIWCFGDDDNPSNNCLDKIIPILKQEVANFLLLNMELKLKDNEVISYIKATSNVTLYKTGERLFRDFGLISATTTLSCLLFKKDDFCIEVFNKFSKKSEVYSHSFSLLHMFYDKPCAFVSDPVLTYSQNTTEEEMYNFGKVYGERFAYYPFTAGLVDLIRVLSSGTNIEVNKILSFNEVEISKDCWIVSHQNLGSFFLNATLIQISQWSNNPNLFDKEAANKLLGSILFLKEKSNNIPDGFTGFVETLFEKISSKPESSQLDNKEISQEISLLRKAILSNSSEAISDTQSINRPVALYFDAGGPLKLLSGDSGDRIYRNKKRDKKINLSILIPSFDRAKEIDKTLGSLSSWCKFFSNQTEIIIVLNTSSDDPNEIADSYVKKFDFIKVHKYMDSVHSAEKSIRRSIKLCKGEYIWTLGDGDFLSLEEFIVLKYLVKNTKKSPEVLFNYALSHGKNLIKRKTMPQCIRKKIHKKLKIKRCEFLLLDIKMLLRSLIKRIFSKP